MIGVFDSGLGGVLTATYIHQHLPAYNLFVVADEMHAPYGERSADWIRERTFHCLHRMFDQGCTLIILACNTASTAAIVARQQQYPDKKVLSISIPGIEEVVDQGFHHIGILATNISVTTSLYPSLFAKHYPEYSIAIEQVRGSGLVTAIESGDSKAIEELCLKYAHQFSNACDALILGCTHYPLVLSSLQKNLPDDLSLINPGAVAAKKLISYLQRHPTLAQQCTTCTGGGTVRVLTTASTPYFAQQCKGLRGEHVSLEIIEI